MPFPAERPRRLRETPLLRDLVRESSVVPGQLIQPLFVKEGILEKVPIASMPGVFQLPLKGAIAEAKACLDAGIKGVLLFGIPQKKDEKASGAYDTNGIVQKAVKSLKDACPNLVVITDVCLCSSMSHGHCGVVSSNQQLATSNYQIDNDATLELLAKTSLSHAEAGADIVAPSDMMDGRVGAIRKSLDSSGFKNTVILSYAVKYASSFYGPFREAAESPPKFGDRKSYQMDPGNRREALREAKLDESEGADILMVKPALPYLDVISLLKAHTTLSIAAYQVSGEYAMICAAAEKGWIDKKQAVLESLTAIRRAGAQLIVTYFAKEVAPSLG